MNEQLFNLWARVSYFLQDFALYLTIIIFSLCAVIFLSYQIFKSHMSDGKKKALVALYFTFLSFVMVYSGFEAYFRYRFDESDSLGFLKVNARWYKRHIVFNNFFYRDRNFEEKKKDGVTRIGVFGDSIAMGYGIKDTNNRFSNLLEKKLKDAQHNVEVYNLGVSGYGTKQELDDYEKTKHLNFDIVIWEYFLNDAEPAEESAGTRVILKEKWQGKLVSFLSQYSYFLDYVYWRLAARYENTFRELRNVDMESYKDPENFKRHKKDVEDFIKELQADNKKFIIVIFPFLYSLPSYPALDIHKTITAIFKEHGVEYIDMLDDLKDKQASDVTVSRFDYHPNEYVQRLVADKLYDKIVPLLK